MAFSARVPCLGARGRTVVGAATWLLVVIYYSPDVIYDLDANLYLPSLFSEEERTLARIAGGSARLPLPAHRWQRASSTCRATA